MSFEFQHRNKNRVKPKHVEIQKLLEWMFIEILWPKDENGFIDEEDNFSILNLAKFYTPENVIKEFYNKLNENQYVGISNYLVDVKYNDYNGEIEIYFKIEDKTYAWYQDYIYYDSSANICYTSKKLTDV